MNINNCEIISINRSEGGFNVTVSYKKTDKTLAKEISGIENPQVLLWYFGEYGLRQEGVSFYKKRLLPEIRKLSSTAECLLYDLTAWGALRDNTKTLDTVNPNVEIINGFTIPRLRCETSACFFDWVKEEKDNTIISYVQNTVLKRSFIYDVSRNAQLTNIKIGDIFKDSLLLQQECKRDCGKSYSAIQYLEGCYWVSRLVKESSSKEINIVFALPNDEDKYYVDPNDSFSVDLKEILQRKMGDRLKDRIVRVMIYTFPFGKQSSNRPYNAGNKNIDVIQKSQVV